MYARLSDCTLVYVREIRPDDKERLAQALAELSQASVVSRFLGAKPSFSAAELRYLTEVDGYDHRALVAVPADAEEERIVAVARYVRLKDDPQAAEMAIVVGDHLQGKGLGSLLARLITDAARERDVHRITASVQSQNRAAIKLMRQIDDRLASQRVGSSVTELVAELVPAPAPDDAPASAPVRSAA
jgi:RimJ/RimL family protein N-acetyltransferase